HIDYVRGLVYIFVGALMGALLQGWLSPFSKVGEKDPSCHMPMGDLEDSNGRVFMWEMLLTLLFVQVMYASVFVRPGHGDVASLAPGLALYAALSTGGQFTGGSPLDIARLFATSVVFKCSWRWTGVFLSAHLTAGLLAAAWTLWAFGKGDHFKRRDDPDSKENLFFFKWFAETDPTSQLRESLLRGGVEAPASMEGGGYAQASATIPP
ncbi:major intrinsic protein superfamily, aquaporin-like protein, partial [Dunaliella salina]